MIRIFTVLLLVFSSLSLISAIGGGLAILSASEIRHLGEGVVAMTVTQLVASVAIVIGCIALLLGNDVILNVSRLLLPVIAVAAIFLAMFYLWGELDFVSLFPVLMFQAIPAFLVGVFAHLTLTRKKSSEKHY